MTVEAPREITADYQLGRILQAIFEKVDDARRLEGGKCTAFVSHISDFVTAISTRGDESILAMVRESRKRLMGRGVSDKTISNSEIIAARQVIENLAEKLAAHREKVS